MVNGIEILWDLSWCGRISKGQQVSKLDPLRKQPFFSERIRTQDIPQPSDQPCHNSHSSSRYSSYNELSNQRKVLRVFLEVRAREDLPLEGRDRQDLFRYSLPLKRGRVVAKDLEQVKVTFSRLRADKPCNQLRKAATYLT